ncbi:MAG TPA: EAL domain-containing response regulator [Acidothermaceae bacterium]|nr:EAL domain-containing response regulator [Acidothermaceae bacterium]
MLERFRDAKVLVVDDNVANVQLLSTLLSRSGLRTVRSALDAQAALDAVRESEPDVILLDLHMPKTDGYAVLERLAIMTDVEYLPVLVLTADTTKDAAHRALSLGARDFLTKPFDATEVVLRVRNLLETRFLYKALRQHNVALADELARRLAEEEGRKQARAERYGRIEKVLHDGSLSIVFQPIVDLATRSTVGLEALSRFASEPLRSPDLWFEEALEVGLGPELEMKAVREAVSQLHRIPEPSFLAVNVSPELVLSHKLEELADESICKRLVLELTENIEVEDYGPIHDRMAPLRERGARVAVDDTGSGFSSLRHILLLQPEIIKLDRSLTHGLDRDPARRALASSLVSFAQDINASLIAEGVETAEELQTLERLGTHWVQGFHIAMPEPLRD